MYLVLSLYVGALITWYAPFDNESLKKVTHILRVIWYLVKLIILFFWGINHLIFHLQITVVTKQNKRL
jgi:hypothetical protein